MSLAKMSSLAKMTGGQGLSESFEITQQICTTMWLAQLASALNESGNAQWLIDNADLLHYHQLKKGSVVV
jgi:hypothetical protein